VLGGYTPALQEAIFRKMGGGPMPEPVRITAVAALLGEHDLEWVEIEGRLLDQTRSGSDDVLTLQQGDAVFTAHLSGAEPLKLRKGSLLKLSGVSALQMDENRQARGFQILLRRSSDVVVLEGPPWIELKHVVLLVALLAGVGFAVHRVHLIKVRASFTAVAEERARMAREIHDTLQQRFVGVLMQLELMAQQKDGSKEVQQGRVDQARALVRSCMAEARRLVQNLRSPALDRADLAKALEGVVQQLTAGTGASIRLTVTGTPRRLPDLVENNLLRIGQEALVNAIKHGQATHIDVELAFGGGAVKLGIQDDGRGFDSDHPPTEAGHFGVVGMRERASQLGSQLQLHSRPGRGTEIRVAVPLES
jgi:signal transduction histidine kinase